ncbi:MAG: hypothetical protein R3F56_13710 [Planctomycetota bacterium]
MKLRSSIALALSLAVVPACTQEPAAPRATQDPAPSADAGGKFIRFVDLGDYRGRLEVAIARYADEKRGVAVDLVSAVHVGDAAYYAALSQRFPGFDAVLYELVAPEGARPDPSADHGFNPISMLQQGMKRMLDLDFQLESIDYEAANFVHADLSAADLMREWRERGETMMSALLKMMTNAAKVQQERYEAAAEAREAAEKSGDAPPELEKPKGRENKRRALKWALGHEMGPMEEMLAMFGDGDKDAGDDKGSGSVLIGERNKKAIEVLQREIAAGKKKLAIFYGAAHMPDMAERLGKLGFVRVREEWVTAWDIGSGTTK